MKTFFCGGSIVAAELVKRMNTLMPNAEVLTAYGLSETGGMVTINIKGQNKFDSVGKLLSNTFIKIVDNDGNSCDIGEDGEILAKVLYPFLGYFNNPEANKNIIGENDWLHTGDIGYFDTEGFLYVIDRKKDIMKYMNYHISPSEIENVIMKHEGVVNVCVVPVPDLVATDFPAALVILNNKCVVTEKEIEELVEGECLRHSIFNS